MQKKKDKIYEVDLYKPIHKHFTNQGYEVKSEVNDCDVTAVKGDELIIIELKVRLNVDLLIQATKRQKLADQVYIAIPKPSYSLFSKKWKDICHLIKRLELGLILVTFLKSTTKMDIVLSPAPFDRKKSMQQNKKKRKKLLSEIEGRHGDHNIGGSNQAKIMTAYKETSIHIAYLIEQFGPLSPKALRQMGTGEKTQSILFNNYYGWFERIQKGIYGITEKGKIDIQAFPQIIEYFSKEAVQPQNSKTEIE
ncbi:DUF2161 domain-containing phosphodiesterase [Heyndrickxia vini]|uniref:Uncharacterized protein n=1 Tax=Heyndrickxia vini TaxID=1476025 RepID=A0ABX7DWB7_9BACI|nr:DUF2161 family putative PD-(D/E)XK-type phosphodiesterase [Heyndrickxia vini]QQZ07793.1 hypothetical protein I5776_11890 [Heyndrickxia vini]